MSCLKQYSLLCHLPCALSSVLCAFSVSSVKPVVRKIKDKIKKTIVKSKLYIMRWLGDVEKYFKII
jgi:hypothetical protein